MAVYGRILRTPGVALLITATTLTRLPFAINGLAVILFLREATGSYGTAGLVAGSLALAPAWELRWRRAWSIAAPSGTGTEAVTWLMTALVAGLSLGTAMAGAVIDARGWPEAVLVGAGVAGAGAVVAFAQRGVLRPALAPA